MSRANGRFQGAAVCRVPRRVAVERHRQGDEGPTAGASGLSVCTASEQYFRSRCFCPDLGHRRIVNAILQTEERHSHSDHRAIDCADKEVGVPSFRRRDSVIDADRVDESTVEPESSTDPDKARALVEEAEAEAAEAEALAAAARARARAARLRRQTLGGDIDAEQEAAVEADLVEADAVESETVAPATTDSEHLPAEDADASDIDTGPRKRRIRRPTWKPVVAGFVVLCTIALLGASGYMIWTHRAAEKLRQQNAEYVAAARQSVVTLMSLDFNNAEADVQRIIDNSTGQFKTDFEMQAADFVKVAQDSKVVTEVNVNSTAVESMSEDAAEVLVAASSRVTNTAGANQEPRTWRLSVSLEREDGQIKMSKVEFVP
nr:hypothetical protein [Mycolicibacterium vaccae]